MGVPFDQIRLIYEGARFPDEHSTLVSYGVRPDDSITVLKEQRGGKPVIYLFPSSPIDALVRLSLAPQWDFDALYPVVPVKTAEGKQLHQLVEWAVTALPNGDLMEKNTGLEVTYLFWEAT